MQHFNKPNINTAEYWDEYYSNREVDFENKLRQDIYWEMTWNKNRVIELGCGLSPYILRFSHGVGLDFAPNTIRYLKKNFPYTNWLVGDACDTKFPPAFFDAVVAGEIIEHMEKPEKLLDEMNRICKVGGKMVISTPLLEFDDPEHLWEFDEEYFKTKGFETMVIESQKFPGRSYIYAWKEKEL